MARPYTPYFSVEPPAVVAAGQTVSLAVTCAGSESLAVRVLDQSETPVWSGTFEPVAQSYGTVLYSAEVDFAEVDAASGQYEFAVQGVSDGVYGPNAYAPFELYHQPEMSIAYPGDGTVTVLPLWVIWHVVDGDEVGIASQTVTVRHGSDVIAQASPDPQVRQVSWHASELGMVNGETYSAEVAAVDGMGGAVNATCTFTTEWEAPPAPEVEVTPDPSTASVTVALEQPRGGTTTYVWRVTDGQRVPVGSFSNATGSPEDYAGSVTDWLPPLGVGISYEAQSVFDETEAGSPLATAEATVDSRSWAVNFSADPADLVTLSGNPSASRDLGHGGEAYHFADAGQRGGLPVWYGTSERDEGGSLTFDTAGPDDARRVFSLSRANPVAWLRDPFGDRWRVHLTPSVKHGVGGAWQLSLKWDALRWEEMG